MVKKRTIAGGLLIGGIVLGTFFSGKLPGFGVGNGIALEAPNSGASKSADDPAPAATEPKPAQPATQTVAQTPDKPVEAQPDEKKEAPKPPDVIDILVDESKYSVSRGGVGNYRDLKLTQIITLAKMTTGNEDGLRVRILRKPSARYLSYATLQSELEAAGLEPESIRMPHDFVE